jgi:hypothetical protein
MTTVADIVRGIGYFDEAETLWALLMVCDQCGRRTIDCRDKQPDGWSADDRLMQVGRDLKAQVPLPALSPEPEASAVPTYTYDASCPHCRDGSPHHPFKASAVPEPTDRLTDDEIAFIDDMTETYVDGSGAYTSRETVARLVLLVRRLAATPPGPHTSEETR